MSCPSSTGPASASRSSRRWPDGWRHLKFLLLASPTWLYLIPGVIAFALGLALVIPLTFGPVSLGPIRLVLHPMLVGAVLTIIGWQMIQLGVLVRICLPLPAGVTDRLSDVVNRHLTIERSPARRDGGARASGLLGGVAIAIKWATEDFGTLQEVRPGIAALVLCVLGAQTIFAAFLYAFFLPASFGGGVAPARIERDDLFGGRPMVLTGRRAAAPTRLPQRADRGGDRRAGATGMRELRPCQGGPR